MTPSRASNPVVDFNRLDRLSRLGILEEPMGYVDGANLYEYVRDDPVNLVDPLGLVANDPASQPATEPWYKKQGCDNDCEGVVEAIYTSIPALPDNGRLANARDKSGFDPLALLSDAYLESSFNPTAKNRASSATGLFQILDRTADDIQDRVWRNFVSRTNPLVPGGGRLRDQRTDPFPSASAAYVYMLDRIAQAGGDLQKGLDLYGTGPGTGYGKRVADGVDAIRSVCGFKPGQAVTFEQMKECAKKHCKELKAALDKAVHR